MGAVVKSVNGIVIKEPTDFEIERYNLTKSGRLANGDMTIDLVAKKRKFKFAYEVVSGPQLDKIREAIDSNTMIFPLVFVENGIEYTAQVYAGAPKYRKFRTDGVWYWKNLTFDLIEK
jgi:hypothetical protein